MTIWCVIWVVLMILWAVFGTWWGYSSPTPADRMGRMGGTWIPFICVLILGLIIFGAIGGGSIGGTLPIR